MGWSPHLPRVKKSGWSIRHFVSTSAKMIVVAHFSRSANPSGDMWYSSHDGWEITSAPGIARSASTNGWA
jgi:hypothetical protein